MNVAHPKTPTAKTASAVASLAESLAEKQSARLQVAHEHMHKALELARRGGDLALVRELTQAIDALEAFGQCLNMSQRIER